MSTYTLTGSGGSGAIGQISQIDLGPYSVEKKFPNKKISISVHEAHGGYIVEVDTHSAKTNQLYIVSEDKDLGNEIGKIITHNILQNESTNS